MQGMHERGSVAEVLSEVLCKALQQLQHRQSLAEELVQALEQERLRDKELQSFHQQAMR